MWIRTTFPSSSIASPEGSLPVSVGTDTAATAPGENGAAAASAFGAGFGGSVWALIEKSQTEPFLAAWADAYRAKFPDDAEAALFFTTSAGPAALQV